MQRRLPWRDTALQVVWLAIGLGAVVIVVASLHHH
jgi:zinc and cadmium transporter